MRRFTLMPRSSSARLLLTAAGALACVHAESPGSRVQWLDPKEEAARFGPDREDTPVFSLTADDNARDYDRIFRWPVVERRYFVPERRCEQGPLELRLDWEPTEYGDYVTLIIYAPRAIEGRLFHRLTSGEGIEGPLGGGQRPDNGACVLSQAEIRSGGAAGPRASGTASVVAPPAPDGVPMPGTRPRSTSVLREIPPPPNPPPGRGLQNFEYQEFNIDLATGDRLNRRIDSVTFVIWFNEPNDLEGATFVIGRRRAEPIAPEAEIRAQGLALRERDAAKKRERARQDEERHRFCVAHHEDTSCWGPGGYEGLVARGEAARRNPPPPPSPNPAIPRGPPPAPLADQRPPSPSAHAEWVAGYWHWSDGNWIWIAGRWRVPTEDVRRELTVRTPSPPPPPQTEARPAQPSPQVGWTPGFWQWDGVRFVWIVGSWQIAPAVGAIWTPDRWERRGGTFVFVPGGWVRR